MKIYLGPYKNWIGPYQITDKIFFWTDRYAKDELEERWDYVLKDKFGDWLASTWVNDFCNWISSKRKRNVKIRIDNYDTWSMDHTLAYIIHPMLIQLKETKHGSPYVDDEDVPEHLRSKAATPLTEEEKQCGRTDDLFHERWEWILDELIWTFHAIRDEDEYEFFQDHKFNHDEYKKHHDRVRKGLLLFGKYYQGLWD
jgi:hypothetical protein